jgi:hypothetical protein
MRLRSRLAAAIFLAGAGLAHADSIDGRWCAEDGRRMDINGPAIVTPGGTAMSGDYDRHGFAFVIPPGEKEAGTPVRMRLRGETTIHLWKGTAGGEPEIWKRCTPVS